MNENDRETLARIQGSTTDRDVYELACIVERLARATDRVIEDVVEMDESRVTKRELNQAISDFAATYLPERV